MMLILSPTKAVFSALAITVFLLLVSSSKAHESSESCLNETAIIQSNAGVASAIEAAINGTLTLEDPLTCSSGSSTLTCSYDFEAASSNLESACAAAGGQYVEYGQDVITLTCQVAANGTSTEVTYVFTNAPDCVGVSCDSDHDHENLEAFTDRIADMLNNFTAIDMCSVAQVTSLAPPTMGAKTLFVITGALVLASTFLL